MLRARGKGSKERVVPVGQAAARRRARLSPARAPGAGQGRCETHLFVNFRGGPLTRQGLYKIVRRHA